MWYGYPQDVPKGFAICDGTGSTPNLTDRFVVGAGNLYPIAQPGGSTSHTHGATQAAHAHALAANGPLNPGGSAISTSTNSQTPAITVNLATTLPPYLALYFIIKL